MKKGINIIYLVLIVFLSACDNEDTGLLDKSGLIYQVKFDSELAYEYTYNESNQVVEEKSKWVYTKHNYQDGKLISSDHYIDPGIYSSSSILADAALKRKEWVNPTNTDKNYTKAYYYDRKGKLTRSLVDSNVLEYSYDSRDRLSRQTFYHDNKKDGYIDFIYDDNDNLITRLHYWIVASGESELQTTTVYEFDNKHNPYKAFRSLMEPGQNTNTNNITKETYTIHYPVNDDVHTTENSYKYNPKGFPITKNGSETFIYY